MNTRECIRVLLTPVLSLMSINAHWFDRTSLSLKPAKWFKELITKQLRIDTGYYYCEAQNWSEENPDAFAGTINVRIIPKVTSRMKGLIELTCVLSTIRYNYPNPNGSYQMRMARRAMYVVLRLGGCFL
jgi:hypothetical protein